jgi:hypothetical protein
MNDQERQEFVNEVDRVLKDLWALNLNKDADQDVISKAILIIEKLLKRMK